jgi:hypothetical protein
MAVAILSMPEARARREERGARLEARARREEGGAMPEARARSE